MAVMKIELSDAALHRWDAAAASVQTSGEKPSANDRQLLMPATCARIGERDGKQVEDRLQRSAPPAQQRRDDDRILGALERRAADH